jgi:NADPH2:quinone reductase
MSKADTRGRQRVSIDGFIYKSGRDLTGLLAPCIRSPQKTWRPPSSLEEKVERKGVMRTIAINHFGGLEVMKEMELSKPTPKSNEILVKIRIAGVNPVDFKIRKGLLQGRMPNEFPIVLGWDGSGTVEEVGSEVKEFRKGDEVFAYARKEVIHDGTYGEYIALEARHLALKPPSLSFEEAAAIPLSGLTAYQSLFESLKLKAGEKILIHAGAGGVGGYAIQLAKNAGAWVITTASGKNHNYVKDLGADEMIDYTKEDFVPVLRRRYPDGIDVVFDTVGGAVQKKSAEVLKRGGALTSVLALDQEYLQGKGVVPGYVFVRPDARQLSELGRLAEGGKLKVLITQVLPLEKAAEAHRLLEKGHGRGKLVLKVF